MAEIVKARFGSPDSIDPNTLFLLPPAMQAEGLRLLAEMGQSETEIMKRTGLGRGAVRQLLDIRKPFLRGGEQDGRG